MKIKVDSYNSLPLEKALTFHYVIIIIKFIFDKNKNIFLLLLLFYYHFSYIFKYIIFYNIFLEKGLYKLPKNNDNK